MAGISLTRMLGNEEREETPLMAEVKPDEKEIRLMTASETYQDPHLLTRFIGELAKRYQADSLHLDSPTTEDKHSLATVYVFSDNKEQDIVGELVQAACWYDNATPGYRLNLTNDQFILEMRDSRRNMRCLWMAERVRGNILVHCSHTGEDAPIISSGYRKFRNNLENSQIL